MKGLIKAEFYKLQKLRSFRMIFLFALAIGILRGFFPYPGYQVYTVCLVPELFDIVLVSAFTAAFICMEFSNRTFGNAFLCGASRRNVFFAKLVAYFPGLFMLILLPLAVSTVIATMRNGFGADWDTAAFEIVAGFLFYILHRFSMAGFAILAASVIHNPVGTLGLSMAGIYPGVLLLNLMGNLAMIDTGIAFVVTTAILLSAAALIFVRRDLK